ncbi:MAG TPA: adenylate/guanylate cyclase domain-containing protein, partial [Mycobacterium sp.]|nr:adenylate/guanylate cyclase domain-containing protein [Mycobacterium sp.]
MDAGARGAVTFLFTDLEGSTGLWETNAVSMDAALRLHDELLAGILERRGGHVFSRAGDSFAAAFGSPSDAVVAAVEVQQGIAVLGGPVQLRARVGLHSGEAYARDGNYFGPAVNRAARLMAAAHGGQVVCSLATEELAAPGLPDEIGVRLLGTFRLRDLLAPETVFQIDGPGLEAAFPALRTLDAVRHNLPVQQTRLIGRTQDVASSLEALLSSRLVTLTGVGGCGKTRLALAVGAELAAESRDGVYFVELAPISDGNGLLTAVIGAMGVRLASDTPAALARFLAGREVVIILDNCEHLLDEV